MKIHHVLGLLLLMVPLLGTAGEPSKDLEKFQGNWLVDTMIERGVKPPEADVKALEVNVQSNVLTVKENGKVVATFKLKLDPAKKPKAVDLIHASDKKEQTDIGIYEIEADTLRLCIDEEGKDRPKEFASPAKSTFSLIVLKRKK